MKCSRIRKPKIRLKECVNITVSATAIDLEDFYIGEISEISEIRIEDKDLQDGQGRREMKEMKEMMIEMKDMISAMRDNINIRLDHIFEVAKGIAPPKHKIRPDPSIHLPELPIVTMSSFEGMVDQLKNTEYMDQMV